MIKFKQKLTLPRFLSFCMCLRNMFLVSFCKKNENEVKSIKGKGIQKKQMSKLCAARAHSIENPKGLKTWVLRAHVLT